MEIDVNENFPRELSRQVEFRAGLVRATEVASQAAKQFAPVRTGAYRDSIQVKVIGPRVYLSATDFKAHWMEWGSVNNPVSAPLRRGVRAAGMKLDELQRGVRSAARLRTRAREFDAGSVRP